ncbi:MAG: DNA gyrase subunit A [Dehalococcoidia bacterium]
MHAPCSVEESTRGCTAMIVTELPYQVNKAQLIEKIADLVRDGKIAAVADLAMSPTATACASSSSSSAKRSVATIKNLLYKHTAMRRPFRQHDGDRRWPARRLGLLPKARSKLFIAHRHEVIRRRTEYQLGVLAREREHILEGLIRAIDLVDLIIATILCR